jgi:hypothetical protein
MAKYHEVNVSRKYRVLKGIAILLNVIGFIVIAIGLLSFIFSLFHSSPSYGDQDLLQSRSPFPFGAFSGIMKFFGLIFSLMFGIMFIGYAQFINLFLDIESNQRTMIELQKQVINNLPDISPTATATSATV